MIPRRSALVPAILALVVATAVYLTQHSAGNRPGQSLPAPATPEPAAQPPRVPEPAAPRPADDNELVARLYSERRSNVIVEVTGQVERTLRDDTQGNPHQRFVVRLSPDLALLVAHNTSLAPRVPLQRGSTVRIRGEYEWSGQGGVLHWTHRDPRRRHQDGWIELDGRRYQ